MAFELGLRVGRQVSSWGYQDHFHGVGVAVRPGALMTLRQRGQMMARRKAISVADPIPAAMG